ncbi:MAG: lytic transglycosylase domain-containing protein [Myxococcales bacterium]|nr:lytic transglycosylase domain-containing protein [Myxococcales bacterium]
MRTRSMLSVAVFSALVLGGSSVAQADIYRYIDKDGVVHFTNIRRHNKRWKRIMRTGPGKARAVSAARRGRGLDPGRFTRYDRWIKQAAALYHIPEALVRAVIHVESNYYPRAVSSAGAQGLMQLMPMTGRGMGVTDPFDPRQNIFGGTRFLRVVANRLRGDLVLTIAAYHAGVGAVLKYGRNIPPYATTQQYVRWVLKKYYRYRKQLAMR